MAADYYRASHSTSSGEAAMPPKRKSRFDNPSTSSSAAPVPPAPKVSNFSEHRPQALRYQGAPATASSSLPSRSGFSEQRTFHEYRRSDDHVPPPPPWPSSDNVVAASGARERGGRASEDSAPTAPPSALETCNVGVLAFFWSKMQRDNGAAEFGPYVPLPVDTVVPEYTPPESISDIASTRVSDFYDELEELFECFGGRVLPDDPSYDYSRRKLLNVNKYRAIPMTLVSDQEALRQWAGDSAAGFSNRSGGFSNFTPAPPRTFQPVPDSSVATGAAGAGPSGLLSAEMSADSNAFESFRRKRANEYHEHLSIKYARLKVRTTGPHRP
ncbi:DNA polymerase III subunit epsilon, putative [Babesia ovata]|uniref:DNA polymerase III subunit epsilon, putative n=1 Tax=Babesia ovata TaxID=189622 RepID=A0A2H6KAT8_9APIC|nr:DNA polymerase III subunit epsilon, putative [Babesia ovata]GBE60111.1 DNA polymerase III subunit epsilon, putative [Babesia ovata]